MKRQNDMIKKSRGRETEATREGERDEGGRRRVRERERVRGGGGGGDNDMKKREQKMCGVGINNRGAFSCWLM